MTKAEEAVIAIKAHLASDLPLPATTEGKVNVIGLCRALRLEPPESYAQHFHRNEVLKDLVNIAAANQGLQPIGARIRDADDALVQKVANAKRNASADARAVIEERAAHDSIYEEVTRLRRENACLTLERDGAVARLRVFEEGGVPPAI